MICTSLSKDLFTGKIVNFYLICYVFRKLNTIPSNFHRFIFLFRWTEERRARRKVVENVAEIFVKDEEKVNSIFFAQQVGEYANY